MIWSTYGSDYYYGRDILTKGIENLKNKFIIIRNKAFETPNSLLEANLNKSKFDFLFLADHCHFYQCLFKKYDVWNNTFIKKTTFVRLNSKKLPFFLELRTPRILSLYVSKDSVIKTQIVFTVMLKCYFLNIQMISRRKHNTRDMERI